MLTWLFTIIATHRQGYRAQINPNVLNHVKATYEAEPSHSSPPPPAVQVPGEYGDDSINILYLFDSLHNQGSANLGALPSYTAFSVNDHPDTSCKYAGSWEFNTYLITYLSSNPPPRFRWVCEWLSIRALFFPDYPWQRKIYTKICLTVKLAMPKPSTRPAFTHSCSTRRARGIRDCTKSGPNWYVPHTSMWHFHTRLCI
jgi:hypothetical protein